MLEPGEPTHADIDHGWLLPAPQPRQSVHTRSIVCRSFRRADGLIDIDARFLDTRPFDYDSEFRGPCPAGVPLHNMQVRVTLDRSRQIVDLITAMPATPYTGCSEVNPNFQRLLGLSIDRGFRKALRERLGGTQGCTHMLALLEAVAAATAQAFGSEAHAPRPAGEARPVNVWKLDTLLGSCWSYRPDGEVVQQLRRNHAG